MSQYKPYPVYKDSGVEWLGRVPEHWQQLPLKRLVRSIEQGWSPECESWPATSDEWGVLKVGCVNGGSFRPEENKALPVSLEPRPELSVAKGDVLVSRANTRELVGSCVFVPKDYPNLLLCDKIYRIRVGELVTPAFLAALITVHGRRSVEIEATGASSSMLNISQSVILDLPVALPASAEQNQIMAATSRETARIDALIEKKTRFIELLREKRQALITHAVTKGLDPKVKMKDSGVEWLGEVPEHWEIKRLQFLSSSIKAGPFGSALTKDMYVPSGYRVYGQEQVIPGDFSIGDYYITAEYFSELAQYAVRPGDVLVSCVGTFGKIAVVPEGAEPGIINPRLIRIRVNQLVDPIYLTMLMRSSVVFEQFSLWSRGGTMDVINIGTLSSITLSIPPVLEQQAILAYVERESGRIDALTKKTESSIGLLKERRSALITAAVTGQIDLREAV